MKKKILISFLLFINLFVSAQINYEQELINLVVADKWFEANDFYKTYKDSLRYEPIILTYKGGIQKAFNHPNEAISYYNNCTEKYASEMHPILLINYVYTPLKDIYIEINQFEKANNVIDKIIEILMTDPSLTGTEEHALKIIESLKKEKQSNITYSAYPPIKIIYDKTERTETKIANNSLKNLLISDIDVNSNCVAALYDTGATDCVITKRIADKVGIKSIAGDSLNLNNDENMKTIMGIIDSLKIGTLKLYNIPVYINETENESMELGIKENATEEEIQKSKQKIDSFYSSVDIIIGLSLLKKLGNMEWNNENSSISFYKKSKFHNPESNLCIFNKGLYLKLNLNENPLYYTALLDTGGDHGLIINKNFYTDNIDLFNNIDTHNLKKRSMHGFAFHLDYYYLQPNHFDVKIGRKILSLNDNCMISEKELSSLSNDNEASEKLAIGISTFVNNKIMTIDFNNMYLEVE
jgi:hypothetical protein